MTPNPRPINRDFLFFDLDNTLYSPKVQLLQFVDQNICRFLTDECGVNPAALPATRRRFAEGYGSTLGGVVHEYGCPPKTYLEFIHAVPNSALPPNSSALRALLKSLPQTKFILTNSYRPYALRVLESLGISDLFSDVLDVVAMGLRYKNDVAAYRTILETTGVRPERAVMFDDVATFLRPAHTLGLRTVHVTPDPCTESCDLHIKSILELDTVLRFLTDC